MKKMIAIVFLAALAAGSTSGCASRNNDGTVKATNDFMGEHPQLDETEALAKESIRAHSITATGKETQE